MHDTIYSHASTYLPASQGGPHCPAQSATSKEWTRQHGSPAAHRGGGKGPRVNLWDIGSVAGQKKCSRIFCCICFIKFTYTAFAPSQRHVTTQTATCALDLLVPLRIRTTAPNVLLKWRAIVPLPTVSPLPLSGWGPVCETRPESSLPRPSPTNATPFHFAQRFLLLVVASSASLRYHARL